MEIQEVTQLILEQIPDAQIHVQGEGCNFSAEVISASFGGINTINRQKKVLSSVKEQIVTGDIHALSVKTYTPEEWLDQNELKIL
jgi:acid stress-induced BolA-like protein IbaG/YrbA